MIKVGETNDKSIKGSSWAFERHPQVLEKEREREKKG
jgi:hypothetical protein